MTMNAVDYNRSRDYDRTTWVRIQHAAGAVPDGVPGPQTADKVADWQEVHGLESDGKAGPATLETMAVEPHPRGEDDGLSLLGLSLSDPDGVYGIDVSDYQGKIAWSKLSRSRCVDFVVIKATEGRTHRQKQLQRGWKACKKHGIPVTAYHLANLVHDGKQTDAAGGADNFLSMFDAAAADLPPALDLEAKKLKELRSLTGSRQAVHDWVAAWLERFVAESGVEPMMYLSRWGMQEIGDAHGELTTYSVWAPDYGRAPELPPRLDKRWNEWTFRQFTSRGVVPGIRGDVDLDRFNGTQNEFEAILRKVDDNG